MLRPSAVVYAAAIIFVVVSVCNYISVLNNTVSFRLIPGATHLEEFDKHHNDWSTLQLKRLDTIRAFCFSDSLKKLSFTSKPVRNDTNFPASLMYNDEYRIIFCHIPKVASTNWKRTFEVLSGIKNVSNPTEIDPNDAHYSSEPLLVSNLTSTEQLWRLATYRKFLFVRHPFERLLSAYIDKLRHVSNSSIDLYQNKLGSQILRKYRPGASEELVQRGNEVTFAEFVQYLTDPTVNNSLADPHWKPMSAMCRPCDITYDFIGKYETMTADVLMILKKLGIQLPFQFPSREGPKANYTSSTRTLLSSHMNQLTAEQIDRLYNIYQNDFELFGYDYLGWNSSSFN